MFNPLSIRLQTNFRLANTEGAAVKNEFGQYDNEFVLRDHLGNTRVTFKDGTNKGAVYY